MGSGPNDEQGHGKSFRESPGLPQGRVWRDEETLACSFSSHSPRYPQLQKRKLPKLHPKWIGSGVILQLNQLDTVINLGDWRNGARELPLEFSVGRLAPLRAWRCDHETTQADGIRRTIFLLQASHCTLRARPHPVGAGSRGRFSIVSQQGPGIGDGS
jgi:hypothetical protein